MRLMVLGAIAAVVTGARPVRADTLPLIENAPFSFLPGVPFTFELHAPNLIGLSSYNLTLQLSAGTNPPPLTLGATPPPGSANYPFPDTSHFTAVPGTAALSLRVSDASSGPPVATAGGNDFLALVTVTPPSDLTLPITLTVTSATFNAFHFPGEPQSTLPAAVTIDPNLSGPASVPAPAGWLMFGIGGLGMAALRNRFNRAVG